MHLFDVVVPRLCATVDVSGVLLAGQVFQVYMGICLLWTAVFELDFRQSMKDYQEEVQTMLLGAQRVLLCDARFRAVFQLVAFTHHPLGRRSVFRPWRVGIMFLFLGVGNFVVTFKALSRKTRKFAAARRRRQGNVDSPRQ